MRDDRSCVLLAVSHPGLSEGIRSLLATRFDTVTMVADETSLLQSAELMRPQLAIADLVLVRRNAPEFIRRLRQRCPGLKVILMDAYDGPTVAQSVLDAGANGFLGKSTLATQLLHAVETVMRGECYVSSGA